MPFPISHRTLSPRNACHSDQREESVVKLLAGQPLKRCIKTAPRSGPLAAEANRSSPATTLRKVREEPAMSVAEGIATFCPDWSREIKAGSPASSFWVEQ